MSRIIYTARVVSTEDPDGLGRVQVALDGFETSLDLPWIRLVGPYASKGFGAVFLPEEDDEVVLLQGDGDGLDQMLCLGSVYNGARKPNYSNEDGDNNVKEIRTRSGHAIVFNDKDGEETLTVQSPDAKLLMKFEQQDGRITLNATGELLLDVTDGALSVRCKDATLEASGEIKVQGDSQISVESQSSTIKVKAASSVEVQSDTEVTVKAPTVSVSGSRVELG